ncbi:MAG: hypothetical protein D6687_03910 [Acidobacteria bacterium]|nr:MAG: hypothetical protein D6687_03910 [Acidobacteriota bacterium]
MKFHFFNDQTFGKKNFNTTKFFSAKLSEALKKLQLRVFYDYEIRFFTGRAEPLGSDASASPFSMALIIP